MGITLTRELLTLILGFFGTAIAGLVTLVMQRQEIGDIKPTLFCHPTLLDYLEYAERRPLGAADGPYSDIKDEYEM